MVKEGLNVLEVEAEVVHSKVGNGGRKKTQHYGRWMSGPVIAYLGRGSRTRVGNWELIKSLCVATPNLKEKVGNARSLKLEMKSAVGK